MAARVSDWMSTEVVSVPRSMHASALASTFASRQVSSVPVVEQGRVVGVVSRADLIRLLALEQTTGEWLLDELGGDDRDRGIQIAEFVARRLGPVTVEQMMSDKPVTLDVAASMSDAARCLVEHRIHHAPVTEGGVLVGVISTFDVARFVAQ